MSTISPSELVQSLFHKLGWSDVTAPPLPPASPTDEVTWLLDLDEFGGERGSKLKIWSGICRGETSLEVEFLRRPHPDLPGRCVASVIFGEGHDYVALRKMAYQGVELVGEVPGVVPLSRLPGESVVEQMVGGVLRAANLEAPDNPQLRWTADIFKPARSPRPIGGGQLACWLCVLSASVLFGIFGFRRLTEASARS
ncbi:MAG: hypothetical protein HYT76_06210 [Deltaproteobacteria bacterium]|nr:hypothetical protein [Deltaproteobacteria bacterium]